MSEDTSALHPILSLVFSLLLFITGLLFVKEVWFWLYAVTFLALFIIFRFERTIISIIPFILTFGALMAALTKINNGWAEVLHAFYRVIALGLAAVLSMSIKPIKLVRSFNQLHVPRWISLGLLIVIRFIQIFREEMKLIKQAIVLRGIRFIESPMLWGRAFFIPLLIRVLSVSEGLAISLETRGFSTDIKGNSYEIIRFKKRDFAFSALFLACLTVYLYLFLGEIR